MNGEIIKSFLVGLGFDVDDSSLAKFNKAIATATVRVTALFAAVNALAAGIFAATTDIAEGFEQMGYEYRIIAPAINKALVLRNELLKAYSAAGINLQKVIVESIKFNMSLAKTKFALEAIYKSVGAKFLPLLTKQMDVFRKQIYANMPRIQSILERFVKFIFKAFEAVNTLGMRVWSILSRIYDFFVMLDKATDGWSTIILGVVAAWKLLNLSFLATPLGMLLAGLTALLYLYDDFKTYQEGGQTLFDWSKAIPSINAAMEVLSQLKKTLESVFDVIFNIVDAFIKLFHMDFSGFADAMKAAFQSVVDVVSKLWDSIKGFAGLGGAVGKALGSLFGDNPDNAATNLQNGPGSTGTQRALGTNNVANSQQTNMNVNQQTSINVQGSADASSTASAVASQQGRVNFDMTRNLKGATR